MMPTHRRTSDTTARQGFQTSVRLLDSITSWHGRGGALMFLLLPVAIALISFQSLLAQLHLFHGVPVSFLVRGFLAIMWIETAFTLYLQRRRLMILRKGLIEQMDSATQTHVRAERFYEASILDPLTGLFNRRFGAARLQEEIE